MSQEPNLKPERSEFESALRSLRPAASGVNAVAAAFTAGRRSGRSAIHRWQCAAGIMLLLGVAAQWRPVRIGPIRPSEHGAGTLAIHPSAPLTAWPDQSLFMLQRSMSEQGVEALPAVHLPTLRNLQTDRVL